MPLFHKINGDMLLFCQLNDQVGKRDPKQSLWQLMFKTLIYSKILNDPMFNNSTLVII